MTSRLFAVAALLILGACDTVYPASQSIDPGFGEAVKYSTAIQVIDPDPVYTAEGARPGDNGEKGAAAVKRYRTGTVKDVQAQATTSGTGGGPN
ncbi:MAG TPA: hypothetical protein VFK50_00605 [Sphingomicrobium sp.]|nr:hypothetical protein [Sphingomicrobium sp.]